MSIKSKMRLAFAVSAAAGLAMSLTARPAAASETRGFVVRWFSYATISEDSDCPHGINEGAFGTFRHYLESVNTPPAKLEDMLARFPGSAKEVDFANRAIVDGKHANAVLNPAATKDTNLYLGEGKKGLGFNLDGKNGPKDFTDPESGETGVDNMFYRATGCVKQLRGAPGTVPAFPEMQWEVVRDHQPAWLVEITTSGDWQNADDATVRIVQARQPVVRDVTGLPQADMTFTTDTQPRTAGNVVHGKIKNGVLTTEKFDFFMPGEVWTQAEFAFKDARMRWTFNPDGTARGLIGGYQNWYKVYGSWAVGGEKFEVLSGLDLPGIYYALRKSADAYPDPGTGQNMAISSTYLFDAIPAFIRDPQTAQAK